MDPPAGHSLSTTWENVTFLRGDLAGAITRLKQQPGRNIGVAGSPTLVRTLLQPASLTSLRSWSTR
jgi:dihydrofolate reductase